MRAVCTTMDIRSTTAFCRRCIKVVTRTSYAACRDLVEIVTPVAAALPMAVLDLEEKALAVRDRYQAGVISWHGQCTAAGRIQAELDRLLQKTYHTQANRRLANHLSPELPYLFTFLHCPDMEATNNRGERAVRPAVQARQLCGGSRTWNGARTQQNLTSVLRTCLQQAKDSFGMLVDLFRNPQSPILNLLPNSVPPAGGPNQLSLPPPMF
jgi:hypothetical protein